MCLCRIIYIGGIYHLYPAIAHITIGFELDENIDV